MDDELIEFKEVSKRFGKNIVFDLVSLSIPEGKITGIIGASGEGKSTMLKMIAGFYTPEKGHIYYRKREIKKDRKTISKIFGLAIEDGSFYEKLSVEENLFHFGKLYSVQKDILKKRVEELIGLVGLEKAKDTLAENLSVGMKKRLDLACSLVHNPAVLVLDEPTADLDPLLRKQMIGLIKDINSRGTTVILTTQLLEEAEEMCEKVLVLFNEKIIEEDNPKKIIKKYGCCNLDEVFNKIFSKKDRKTYQESKIEKTKVEPLKKISAKTLAYNKEELDELIEKSTKKQNSESLLEEIRGKDGN